MIDGAAYEPKSAPRVSSRPATRCICPQPLRRVICAPCRSAAGTGEATASPSSRGLGHRPFTAVTGVRIPLGTPFKSNQWLSTARPSPAPNNCPMELSGYLGLAGCAVRCYLSPASTLEVQIDISRIYNSNRWAAVQVKRPPGVRRLRLGLLLDRREHQAARQRVLQKHPPIYCARVRRSWQAAENARWHLPVEKRYYYGHARIRS